MKKRLIPFWMLPASWGLSGTSRELAEIDYTYKHDDHARETERAKVLFRDQGSKLEEELLKINKAHKKIPYKEFKQKMISLLENGPEKDRAQLEFDREWDHITQDEYEKGTATLNKEPWVKVKNIDTAKDSPAVGSIELDWNEYFVGHLEENGFGPNPTEEQTVDQWLSELCRNIALDAFDGVADYSERLSKVNANMHNDVIIKRNDNDEAE